MDRLRFVISLTNDDNDYQVEQATVAINAANRLGVHLEIIHADNDSITQSQQLLQIIQSDPARRPHAIIFEPVGGTAMPQVAKAAVSAGIGWVVLNRDAEYLPEMRKSYRVPVFSVTSDHTEVGRIQGHQIATLLPSSGSVLYIQGPSGSLAARQRTIGMSETKPAYVQVKPMRAQWTEGSARKVVASWLRLSTSLPTSINLVAAQDDSMAIGARKAFQDIPDSSARDGWLRLPFLGCDGLPGTGQEWVQQGLLTATIYIPPSAGKAVEMMAAAIQDNLKPPEQTLVSPVPFPSFEQLSALHPSPRLRSASTL